MFYISSFKYLYFSCRKNILYAIWGRLVSNIFVHTFDVEVIWMYKESWAELFPCITSYIIHSTDSESHGHLYTFRCIGLAFPTCLYFQKCELSIQYSIYLNKYRIQNPLNWYKRGFYNYSKSNNQGHRQLWPMHSLRIFHTLCYQSLSYIH